MSHQPLVLVPHGLAQAAPPPPAPQQEKLQSEQIWMGVSGVIFLLFIITAAYFQIQLQRTKKKLRLEEFRSRDLQKKIKLALGTISKMEKNPDLIDSREFNLDYLRMRMGEDNFNFAIVNQVKVKVKERISMALRPTPETRGQSRQVDEIFDVEYETGETHKTSKRTLFRIQIKLTKLPTQSTSSTVNQLVECIETYLSPVEEHETWQPTIQGKIAYIDWDQKAKPTPLLVLGQTQEGVNVTFRQRRKTAAERAEAEAETKSSSPAARRVRARRARSR